MGKRKAPADSDNKSDAEKTTKSNVSMKGRQSKKAKDANAIDSIVGVVEEKQKSEKKAPVKGRQSKKAKEAAVDESTNGDLKPTKEKKKPEKKSPASLKKKEDKNDDAGNDDGAEDAVPAKKAKVTDFGSNAVTKDGKKWNLKIVSWNVNGIRAWVKKGCLDYLKAENADIYCLQETKCDEESLPDEVTQLPGYHAYWLSADKGGYSGVGLFSKTVPLSVTYGIGIEKHDNEGRVITAEYPSFYLINAYVPNSGRGLPRLPYRSKEWDIDFRQYLKELDKKKPIILCGDLNVAHNEIDIANPKSNKKTAGFTEEEREGFTNLLAEGYVDTFRHLYPDVTGAYTYWSTMSNSRAKNVGWRLDYFVMSSEFAAKALCDSVIRADTTGSDHCPIALLLNTQ